MNKTAVVDRYGTMDPGIMALLNESLEYSRGKERRSVRCPLCGFPLLQVYGRNHVVVELKCRKCKFSEPIDLALFRTMRHRRGF